MKKRVSCIAAFFSAALLFYACGNGVSLLSNQQAEQGASSSVPAGSENSQLKVVTSVLGLTYTARAGTNNGYYELWCRPDGSANILYTDYKTKQRVYLSAQPNSDHHNEADPSWIKYTIGGTVPFVTATKLYVCQLGLNDLGLSYKAEDLPKVWQMDLNGDNRRELFSLPADETFCESSVFVADEQNLYVLVKKHFEEGTEFQLLRVYTTTGEKNLVDQFPYDADYNVVGCFPKGLLITTVTTKNDKTQSWKELYENQVYTLNRYFLDTGKLEPILTWKQGDILGVPDNEKFYYWERSTCTIKSLDIATLEKRTIAQNVFSQNLAQGAIKVTGSYDSHILFLVSDESYDSSTLFAIDLSSGLLSTLKMQCEDRKISIFAEGPDCFVVNAGENSVSVPDVAIDGTPMETMIQEHKMALITKEDYWNNRENFIEIQDRVTE
ncbi:MAG: hypothetical protein PHG73_08245 [Pygmaiobacter sp.]|nr:hypothetical protein [Pygmaiobacter sp.]